LFFQSGFLLTIRSVGFVNSQIHFACVSVIRHPDAMFEVFRTEHAPTALSDGTQTPVFDSDSPNSGDSGIIDLF